MRSSRSSAAIAIAAGGAVPAEVPATIAAAFAVTIPNVAVVDAAPVRAVAVSLLLLRFLTMVNDRGPWPTACPNASATTLLHVACHIVSAKKKTKTTGTPARAAA